MKRTVFYLITIILTISLIIGCGKEEPIIPKPTQPKLSGKLSIFHAGSLAKPFEVLEQKFETRHPEVDVQREASGSRTAVKKVTELGRQAGVIASADYTVIETLMLPAYANWYAKFARNQMVIAYTTKSKYQAEITKDNWYEILQRPDVAWGHADPNQDPCGYRTVLVTQLAELYYQKPGLAAQLKTSCPKKNIRPKSVELIVLLGKGELDYAFEYSSVATQHNLKFLELPDELNLSNEAHTDFYQKAEIKLTDGKVKKGKPIVYGVTIPKDAENREAALEFVKLLLADEGMEIMQQNGQPPIKPAVTHNLNNLPEELRFLVKER